MQLVGSGEAGACVIVRCNSLVGVGCLDGKIVCFCLAIKEGISMFPDLEGCMKQMRDELGSKSGGAVLIREVAGCAVNIMSVKPGA